jgi:hypothetical protein
LLLPTHAPPCWLHEKAVDALQLVALGGEKYALGLKQTPLTSCPHISAAVAGGGAESNLAFSRSKFGAFVLRSILTVSRGGGGANFGRSARE